MTTPLAQRSRAFLQLLRVRQWHKNLLVFAAPAAGGILLRPDVLGECLLAFLAFGLVASAGYCFNDAKDVDKDRMHPHKQYRPVARGQISVLQAQATAVVLVMAGVGVAGVWLNVEFALILAFYAGMTATYSALLKHVPVVELVVVASGFLLRGLGGAAATELEASQWFLIASTFGALLLVTGKRLSEVRAGALLARKVIVSYSAGYLRTVAATCAGVLLTSYCLWAFEQSDDPGRLPGVDLVTVVPVLIFVLQYLFLIDSAEAERPERLVFTDIVLRTSSVAWVVLFLIATYA